MGASVAPRRDNFRFPIVLLPGEHFLVSKVVTAERVAVLLPTGLQAGNEPLFDGGANVAVDPADPGRIGDRHTAVARADADWLTRLVDRMEQDHDGCLPVWQVGSVAFFEEGSFGRVEAV